MRKNSEINKIDFDSLKESRLMEILTNLQSKKVGVVGDCTLDIYWNIDMKRSELSRETPHHPYPAVNEKIYLGGGGNVGLNLKSFGVEWVSLLTVIGKDWRGMIFEQLIDEERINKKYILKKESRITPAYCKPLLHGYSDVVHEVNRVDFENVEPLEKPVEISLKNHLSNFFFEHDLILIADQLKNGIVLDSVRTEIINQATKYPQKLVIADSRDSIVKYSSVILKPNSLEAWKAVYPEKNYENYEKASFEDWIEAGCKLHQITGAPVLLTLGDKGATWINMKKEGILYVPAFPVKNPIDVVGAGDTYIATFGVSMISGAEVFESMIIASLASSIVVQKIGVTGSVTPQELIERFKEAKKLSSSLR